MKQATILLSFTFLLPSVHLSVKNVHLLLPMSAERGQMMNWRLGETFNLLLNWILLMYFWKNSVYVELLSFISNFSSCFFNSCLWNMNVIRFSFLIQFYRDRKIHQFPSKSLHRYIRILPHHYFVHFTSSLEVKINILKRSRWMKKGPYIYLVFENKICIYKSSK